jgi:hypothetical protein
VIGFFHADIGERDQHDVEAAGVDQLLERLLLGAVRVWLVIGARPQCTRRVSRASRSSFVHHHMSPLCPQTVPVVASRRMWAEVLSSKVSKTDNFLVASLKNAPHLLAAPHTDEGIECPLDPGRTASSRRMRVGRAQGRACGRASK